MRRSDDFLPARRDPDWGFTPRRESSWGSPSGIFTGSPWQMMRRMQEDMDRLFGQFFSTPFDVGRGLAPAAGQALQWAPSVDVSQSDREWCIEAELPGVNHEDIQVNIQNHHLILRAETRGGTETPGEGQGPAQGQAGQAGGAGGPQRQYLQRERRYGFFERVIPLPENVDEEKVSCEFRNGVLTVHLPKSASATPQARRIPITGEGQPALETSTAPGQQAATVGGPVGGRTSAATGTTPGQTGPGATPVASATGRGVATAGSKGGAKSTTGSRNKTGSSGTAKS
jgi:HSP20 family protein